MSMIPDVFKKVSTALLPVAGTYPFLRSMLQQWSANLNAIARGHLHRGAVGLYAKRPLLLHGEPHQLCIPPLVMPFGVDDTEVLISVDYECVDAPVTLYGALILQDGMTPRTGGVTVLVGSGQVEIAIPIPGRERIRAEPVGVCYPVLIADSQESGSGIITVAPTISDEVTRRWMGTNTSTSPAAGSVYKIRWDDSGGAVPGEELPAERLVLGKFFEGTHLHFVWPLLSLEESTNNGAGLPDWHSKQSVELVPIGHLKIGAVGVRISGSNATLINLNNYAGGQRTSARWLRKIVATSERHWRRKAPIMGMGEVDFHREDPHGGAAPYNGGKPVLPLGAVVRYPELTENNAFKIIASTTVGSCLESRDLDDNSIFRSTYEIFGLVACIQQGRNRGVRREVTIGAALYDTNASGTVVSTEELAIQLDAWEWDAGDSSPLNFDALFAHWRRRGGVGLGDLFQSTANGLMPYELALGGLSALKLRPWRLTIVEDATEVATSERLLRLRIKGPQSNFRGPFWGRGDNCWTWVPMHTVTVQRRSLR